MALVILILVIMVVGVYFRTKFDKEYAMPTIAENKDLSLLYKWGLILLAVSIICFILHLEEIAFGILILLIPFVLYLNLKTYWIAIKKARRKNRDRS